MVSAWTRVTWAGGVVAAGGVALGLAVTRGSDVPEARAAAGVVFYIDEGGEVFRREARAGDAATAVSPRGLRAVPAEPCYWTKEGSSKRAPTWVRLEGEAMACPDCGRRVVAGNPPPGRGTPPPPVYGEGL